MHISMVMFKMHNDIQHIFGTMYGQLLACSPARLSAGRRCLLVWCVTQKNDDTRSALAIIWVIQKMDYHAIARAMRGAWRDRSPEGRQEEKRAAVSEIHK